LFILGSKAIHGLLSPKNGLGSNPLAYFAIKSVINKT
jgi:hypothetical protein